MCSFFYVLPVGSALRQRSTVENITASLADLDLRSLYCWGQYFQVEVQYAVATTPGSPKQAAGVDSGRVIYLPKEPVTFPLAYRGLCSESSLLSHGKLNPDGAVAACGICFFQDYHVFSGLAENVRSHLKKIAGTDRRRKLGGGRYPGRKLQVDDAVTAIRRRPRKDYAVHAGLVDCLIPDRVALSLTDIGRHIRFTGGQPGQVQRDRAVAVDGILEGLGIGSRFPVRYPI